MHSNEFLSEYPEGSDLPVQLSPSKKARRLALRLDVRNRAFKLVKPKYISKRRAVDFARKHENWMREKISALPPRIEFKDGVTLPILGQDMTLDIHMDPERKQTKITLTGSYLNVRTNKPDPTARINRFLKQEVKRTLIELSHEKAEIINERVNRVSVRDTTSRWGSCSPDGNLSYSWRLIFAPLEVIDYLVAHEVAHLKHLDHSPAFWTVCAGLSKNYEAGKSWIRQNGHDLMRYG